MNINPIYLKDFYKVGHRDQYPKGTNLIFSNFTPRKSRMEGVNHSVFFGLQYFIQKYLLESFNDSFFFLYDDTRYQFPSACASETVLTYNGFMHQTLGFEKDYSHIGDLFKLGYLPIAIYALPELSVVPSGVPALVMFNTHPDFYWLPNMLETLMSCTLWGACTSATIAHEYRLLLDKFAKRTSGIPEFVDYQAHDFSFRGMNSVESACISGMAHLQYFKGTDTIPALIFNKEYYGHNLHVASVPATEHSVMSAGGKENEIETFERLLDIYPTGIISVVSDTWDLWSVVNNILPRLKDRILSRNGKLVIRPDSGDPVKIICGDDSKYPIHHEEVGLIECLWEIFGGTINSKGYKQLDEHIGAIYGDSITIDRARNICERLESKGFASTNIVFGIGSYTYQYNTRDTLGWAMKATYCEVNGEGRAITKDPITDDGTKKSHSGILKVVRVEGAHGKSNFQVLQNQTWDQFNEDNNELKLVFKNGQLIK